jgi:uncharacterized membrane protein YoaK (UPF0700 family)
VSNPATSVSVSASHRSPALEGFRRSFVDEREGPLPGLLLALTLLAGVLDAATILRLGHVFVSTTTGNFVFLGLAAAGATGFAVLTPALAIGGFAVGVLIGGRACRAAREHRGRVLRNVMRVKVILALTANVIILIAGEDFSVGVRDTVVVLMAMSMGAQLFAIRYLKVPDLVTVVTTFTLVGGLTEYGSGWTDPTVLRRALALLAFALGVLSGALLVLYVSLSAALAFGLGIIVLVAIAAHRVSRSEADWTAPR